ncbi:MAG: alpha-glucoside-specific PTS transporter subunit IIBC [Alkalibacterium sp.]|uniref:alpha-glucoside-specific PTS transporter subunit IIBC n=1 Tax=Alkalibacterium sp. TaxID=1872447 RepID=UPI0039711144
MKEKLQRFGGAMFTPVLLFAFSGIMVAFALMFNNTAIVGSIAAEGTLWHAFWTIIENGAWTVFRQMEIMFVIGIALGLAKKANARAVMEAVVTYLTFNYFLSSILELFGTRFGVDFTQEVGGTSGLKMIAGIKTLDTGVLGAIAIASVVVFLHNRYFDKKLPEWLGIFQGSSFVVIVGFFTMLPLSLLTASVWPAVQTSIASTQVLMINSGPFGVWLYTFLERILIPTGLHHFIYTPFMFGPAIVEGGIVTSFIENIPLLASTDASLVEVFPQGAFALHGNSKLFAAPGIALAFYFTAKKENRKKVAALVIPATLTAVLAGITEPLEFTFLFVAPVLFLVHALLAATMSTVMYSFGVVGDMGGGLIEIASKNWIPLFSNHAGTYIAQIIIGLAFTGIYFMVFRYLIVKFDYMTPGRSEVEGAKLYGKADYREKQANGKKKTATDRYADQALAFIDALGGADNIDTVNNCATRLRVKVIDAGKVKDDSAFNAGGAMGIVRSKNAFQVIVGLSVPQVREAVEIQIGK